jgi:DNA polymerase III subunit beta
MRAVFDREGLAAAFGLVAAVVPARTPKPVLQNVKVICGQERTILMATDQETAGIRYEVRGVTVEDPGEALLPRDRMLAILREASDQELKIEADENATMIRGVSSEFELPGEDPTQYPDTPGFTGEKYHQIGSGVLKELIGRTIFAAAVESHRYAMTGVLWELDGTRVRLVATDGRRLAVADGTGTTHGGHTTAGQTPVVPTKVMTLLERNLSDADEQVCVTLASNQVLFKTGRAEIHGRLVEGRYPPYKEVFPKKVSAKIPLAVTPLMRASRQAAILTDEESRGVNFTFDAGKLTLQARVADKGRAKIEIPISHDGKPITITFDPKLVVDMLKVLDPEGEVMLELLDERSAALFKASDTYSYIVMPLNR